MPIKKDNPNRPQHQSPKDNMPRCLSNNNKQNTQPYERNRGGGGRSTWASGEISQSLNLGASHKVQHPHQSQRTLCVQVSRIIIVYEYYNESRGHVMMSRLLIGFELTPTHLPTAVPTPRRRGNLLVYHLFLFFSEFHVLIIGKRESELQTPNRSMRYFENGTISA